MVKNLKDKSSKFIIYLLESYHKYECGNRDMFGKILDNIQRDGKKSVGSMKELSKLCYRVKKTFSTILWLINNLRQ